MNNESKMRTHHITIEGDVTSNMTIPEIKDGILVNVFGSPLDNQKATVKLKRKG